MYYGPLTLRRIESDTPFRIITNQYNQNKDDKIKSV